MTLAPRVAFVSGGAQGIGRAIALRLAAHGADIALNGLALDERLRATQARIEAAGRRCALVPGDIGRVADAFGCIASAVEQLGRLDILVNNAGIEKQAAFLDINEAAYDQVLDTNLKGAFFLAQAFAGHLKAAARGGRIINISSVHEELPFPGFTPYCLSKGGMKMLMRNLAVELAPLGITVNNIAPGAIETPINTELLQSPERLQALLANIPLGRLGQPADVAGAAAFLASDDPAYITRTTLVVDGGLLWNYQER